MTDSSDPCLHCGGFARTAFCSDCLPPYGEWQDKRAYHRRYNELHAMAGKHPSWRLAMDLPRYHPARVPLCETDGCGRHQAVYRKNGEWTRRNKRFCERCISRRNKRKRNGLDPDTGRLSRPGSLKGRGGYLAVWAPDSPMASSDGYVLEHRMVMASLIGRPLLPHENVHHKNGVKTDNRPENLERWTVPQPSGQRVEDLVAWVVGAYPDEVSALLNERLGV